jgi:hypothetical protein
LDPFLRDFGGAVERNLDEPLLERAGVPDAEAEAAPKHRRRVRWPGAGPAAVILLSVLLPIAAGCGSSDESTPAAATPSECFEALDLADEAFGNVAEFATVTSSILDAATRLDPATMEDGNVELGRLNAEMVVIMDDYRSAAEACRSE